MNQLSLEKANAIITAALAHSKTAGYLPMGIVVVDAAGQTKAFAREDGATALRFDIALGKACAAVGMGCSSRTLTERAATLAVFMTSLSSASSQHFIAQTGAVLVKDSDGSIIGAVGASGGTGDEDEAICMAGIVAAGFKYE